MYRLANFVLARPVPNLPVLLVDLASLSLSEFFKNKVWCIIGAERRAAPVLKYQTLLAVVVDSFFYDEVLRHNVWSGIMAILH